MTSIVLMNRAGGLSFLMPQLKRTLPDVCFTEWPEPGWEKAEVALCWQPPLGALASMPNLRLIHSIGAGVDSIMADPELPNLPICRVVDATLATAMAEFILWAALYFHRQFDAVIANAHSGHWHRFEQVAASDRRVGLMGLGAMGEEAARLLLSAGYQVSGWSRSPKQITGVRVFSGDAGLIEFLEQTDILVCLLPLTPQTQAILDRNHLARLPKGAALVLCSRGEHVVIDDLLELLRAGHLRGAILDVFEHEPLPLDHPLWREPGVLVTPHMAGLAKPRAIAAQIAENVNRMNAGKPLLNLIDTMRGY